MPPDWNLFWKNPSGSQESSPYFKGQDCVGLRVGRTGGGLETPVTEEEMGVRRRLCFSENITQSERLLPHW